MLPGSARLPVDALARLVRDEHIGELPDVLAPAAVWRPAADEEAAGVRAHDEAARLGWLDRRGRLDGDVTVALSVVCQSRVEFRGWINSRDTGSVGVLVAATGREAILAVAKQGQILLRRAQSRKLPETLAAQLPDVRVGNGSAISVPLDEVRNASEATTGPVPRADLRKVLDIASLESTGSGELWVAVRDNLGRRRQVAYPLRYADTTSGRYLVTMSESGEIWLLVAPASRNDVALRLRNLHQEIANPDK